MVGPGALKPTVGDGKRSSRLLVHIVIDILLFLLCTYLGVCNNNNNNNTRATHPALSCACERYRAGSGAALFHHFHRQSVRMQLSVRAGQSLYKSDFHAKIVAVGKYGILAVLLYIQGAARERAPSADPRVLLAAVCCS